MTAISHPFFVWLPVAVVVAVAMELWAALLHGRVWHAWLWPVHRSHHVARTGRFEWNDALSALHAPIAIALVLFGCRTEPGLARELAFGAGVGMTFFGMAYAIVHDGLVHGRLPVRFLLRLPYFRGVSRAHRTHHLGVEGGPPFGLFFGPLELARHRALKARSGAACAPRRVPSVQRSADRARARPSPRQQDGAAPSSGGTP